MKSAQFLVMTFSLMSNKFEFVMPSGMSIYRSLSRQTIFVSSLVMLLKP